MSLSAMTRAVAVWMTGTVLGACDAPMTPAASPLQGNVCNGEAGIRFLVQGFHVAQVFGHDALTHESSWLYWNQGTHYAAISGTCELTVYHAHLNGRPVVTERLTPETFGEVADALGLEAWWRGAVPEGAGQPSQALLEGQVRGDMVWTPQGAWGCEEEQPCAEDVADLASGIENLYRRQLDRDDVQVHQAEAYYLFAWRERPSDSLGPGSQGYYPWPLEMSLKVVTDAAKLPRPPNAFDELVHVGRAEPLEGRRMAAVYGVQWGRALRAGHLDGAASFQFEDEQTDLCWQDPDLEQCTRVRGVHIMGVMPDLQTWGELP